MNAPTGSNSFIASVVIPETRDRAIITCDGAIYNVPFDGPEMNVYDRAVEAFTRAMSVAKSIKQEEINHAHQEDRGDCCSN